MPAVDLKVRTGDGEAIHLELVAYANLPAIAVDHPQTCIKEIRLERLGTETVGLHDAPEHIHGRSASVEWIRQDIPENSSIVIGLRRGETQSFTTAQVTRSGIDPVEEAVNVLERASVTPDEHLENHRAGWGRFWDKSGVQVPDEKIESLWYMGLYMLASSSRENGCAASLYGLWSPDSCIPPRTVSISGTSTHSIGDFTQQTIWSLARCSVTIFYQFSRVSKNRPGSSTDGMAFLSPES